MENKNYLRLKIFFGPTNRSFETPEEDFIVGVVQKVLGDNNKWHDSFSPYSVSGLLGGKIENGALTYPEGGYFYVSSYDNEFINLFVSRLYEIGGELMLRDMKFQKLEIQPVFINKNYDIVKSISPILVKNNNKYLTYTDDGYIETLTDKCKAKLIHLGFSNNDVNKLSLELFHPENSKIKYTKRKNFSIPASKIMLIVKGNSKCRKALYETGIGNSTGYGYGAIEIVNNTINNF